VMRFATLSTSYGLHRQLKTGKRDMHNL